MDKIELQFSGPFTLVDGERSVFHCGHAKSPGIYLWVIDTDKGNHIHYIGETRQFAKRQAEHLTNVLGLNYGIFDVEKAKHGICSSIWGGMWRDKGYDKIDDMLNTYVEICPKVLDYLRSVKVFFAKYNGADAMRKHIEGCIAKYLREKESEFASLYPADNHTMTMQGLAPTNLVITSAEVIRGLPKELEI